MVADLRHQLDDANNKLSRFTGVPPHVTHSIILTIIRKFYTITLALLIPATIAAFADAVNRSETSVREAFISASAGAVLATISLAIILIWGMTKSWETKDDSRKAYLVEFKEDMRVIFDAQKIRFDELLARILSEHEEQIKESYDVLTDSVADFAGHMNAFMQRLHEQGTVLTQNPKSDAKYANFDSLKHFRPSRQFRRKIVDKTLGV